MTGRAWPLLVTGRSTAMSRRSSFPRGRSVPRSTASSFHHSARRASRLLAGTALGQPRREDGERYRGARTLGEIDVSAVQPQNRRHSSNATKAVAETLFTAGKRQLVSLHGNADQRLDVEQHAGGSCHPPHHCNDSGHGGADDMNTPAGSSIASRLRRRQPFVRPPRSADGAAASCSREAKTGTGPCVY